MSSWTSAASLDGPEHRGAGRGRADRRPDLYDDLFELTGHRRLAIEHGRRRLSVLFGAGYPYAQVYVPPGAGFVCLEPMSAPTNALVAGGCPVVGPGESFTAWFWIRPDRIRPGTG